MFFHVHVHRFSVNIYLNSIEHRKYLYNYVFSKGLGSSVYYQCHWLLLKLSNIITLALEEKFPNSDIF